MFMDFGAVVFPGIFVVFSRGFDVATKEAAGAYFPTVLTSFCLGLLAAVVLSIVIVSDRLSLFCIAPITLVPFLVLAMGRRQLGQILKSSNDYIHQLEGPPPEEPAPPRETAIQLTAVQGDAKRFTKDNPLVLQER